MTITIRNRALGYLPHFQRSGEEPIFREAWEAEAFVLVMRLHEAGHFSWDEWTTTLASNIRAAQAAGDPDLGDSYYHHWLAALEQICTQKRLVDRNEADEREAAWRRAYATTPHGQAVELVR